MWLLLGECSDMDYGAKEDVPLGLMNPVFFLLEPDARALLTWGKS